MSLRLLFGSKTLKPCACLSSTHPSNSPLPYLCAGKVLHPWSCGSTPVSLTHPMVSFKEVNPCLFVLSRSTAGQSRFYRASPCAAKSSALVPHWSATVFGRLQFRTSSLPSDLLASRVAGKGHQCSGYLILTRERAGHSEDHHMTPRN